MVDVFFGGLMELKAIQLRLSAICFSDHSFTSIRRRNVGVLSDICH